ncbi:exodeoxyribonuclease VII large subunit [Hyphomicrobium nitrativorans NL23]|uniref:Exodeoxyribonuclease 7 large subunit n=1 Tax=Hyphomicrobium nitrativorans NL23 TaxID=1029756 RepID=V5SFF7_9HYPH|nr:exodeoxyribonuclease VII large subunit [Hyphomicrobium nitrativorans]AHB48770.1 exodeoxyribonuclease VII large subunit [Hyphomicrobium nitrativorans NL23]
MARAPSPPPAQSGNVAEFSVSELSNAIKRALEDGFGHVRLRGEISGYRGPHASGHCYFALKDEKARIDAVVWRGVWGRLRFKPEEGMEVIATGKISSFPGSSKYQIVIEQIEPAGLGALMAQLEERKRRLTDEGLFADERKRPLPFLPRVVGIVTSPTGAVIRDMLHGFTERFPTRVIVWPVRVQGEGSAAEVARAVAGFNALRPDGPVPRPDVLIVARGGGSLEDLWSFNDEAVVRAVAASAIPVISAVGHETDWTLIDLAADARAPTPTKAAEWAVPKYADLLEQSGKLGLRLTVAVRRVLDTLRRDLRSAARGLPRVEDLAALPRQRLDTTGARLGRALSANTQAHHTRHVRIAARLNPGLLSNRLHRAADRLDSLGRRARECLGRTASVRRARLERASGRLQPAPIRHRVERCQERLEALTQRARRALDGRLAQHRNALEGQTKLLGSLGYQSVLARGFALVRDADGAMVRAARAVSPGQALEIEFADGRINADAREGGSGGGSGQTGQSEAPSTTSAAAATPPNKAPRGGQGSLF